MARRERFPEEIDLQVEGPLSILPIPFTAKAKLNETWFHFLARNGLKLIPADKLVIRTYNGFKANDKKSGWTAELNEPIERFILKFTRAKIRYSVKLAFKERLERRQSQDHQRRAPPPPSHSRSSINLQGGQPPQNIGQQSRLVYRTPNSGGPRQPQPPRRRGRPSPPSVVIPTGRGRLPIIPPEENSYRKPRYTPGIINGSPRRGSTQSRYGTRFKGLSDKINGRGGKRGGGRKEGALRMKSPQEGMPRGPGGGDGGGRQSNLAGVPSDLVQVKVECEEEDGEDGGDDDEEEVEVDFGLSEMEEDQDGEEDDDEDDNLSLITGVSTEIRQLRREGIEVEDVKSKVMERFKGFNNFYFLRMRKEIQDLRKKNLWVRNVEKAPMACYMLQEMLNLV